MSDINGVYKVCAKREDKNSKTWWDDTGLRVFIGEWEGKPTVNVFDARLGTRFPAFKIEKNIAPAGDREMPPPPDDVPF